MRVRIYQINPKRDPERRLIFRGWKEFQQQGYERPPAELYDQVYSYWTKATTPEGVYERFNLNQPANYRGRSLSPSDVVEFLWDTGEHSFFFCDIIGFQPVEFDAERK